ncbi:MAG: DEAD/DEAH box helicase, partial [Candidatus Heimdallarchaeota archaeon]
MTKSYRAVVKQGKIFLNEPTDLPEGTYIQLVETESSYQPLIQQIDAAESITPQIPVVIERNVDVDTQNQFDKFDFHKLIKQAIAKVGYTTPTLIQNQAIQSIIDKKDVLGIAKTGSGKTAAFALPILNNLLQQKREIRKQPKVLIITPTRELAIQIGVSFDVYGRYTQLKQVTIFGGVKQKNQVDQLQSGWVPILVATPGRLLDLMKQGFISLDYVKILVLDEADRMLDMGFIPDIKRIVSKIPQREQSLLFSATMPMEILDLAKSFLDENFVHVTGDQTSIPIDNIKQEIYFVEKGDKLELLENILSH